MLGRLVENSLSFFVSIVLGLLTVAPCLASSLGLFKDIEPETRVPDKIAEFISAVLRSSGKQVKKNQKQSIIRHKFS